MARKKKVTIKDTVFQAIHKSKGRVTYEEITAIVKQALPGSKWQKSHWAWYRYQIREGRFVNDFSATERRNLVLREESNRFDASDIKVIGDGILNHVRFVLDTVTSEDDDLRFKLNRWVFSMRILKKPKLLVGRRLQLEYSAILPET